MANKLRHKTTEITGFYKEEAFGNPLGTFIQVIILCAYIIPYKLFTQDV